MECIRTGQAAVGAAEAAVRMKVVTTTIVAKNRIERTGYVA
jgi:hypothetical protein